MCREWFQHPNGALPAYEWSFDDVNPPVHALAALARLARSTARGTCEFLERIFHKLLMNFTWWLNREDAEGNDLFSGGFLGLDNIGAFDRSHLPVGGRPRAVRRDRLDVRVLPVDAARWRRSWPKRDPAYEDLMTTFLEHAVRIAAAMNTERPVGRRRTGSSTTRCGSPDGTTVPLKVHSMVGLLPLLPARRAPAASGRARRRRSASTSRASSADVGHDRRRAARPAASIIGRPAGQIA